MRPRDSFLVAVTLLAAAAYSAPGIAASISGPSSSTTGTFTLTWTAGYYLAGDAGTIDGPPTTSHGFNDLPTGTYRFVLWSCYEFWDEGGHHQYCDPDPSTEKTVTVTREAPPPLPPSAITGPTTDTDGAYTISWVASSGATSYELQEQKDGGTWSTIQNTSATTKSFTVRSDATWGYRVRACIGTSCSAWTETHAVQVLNSPSAPGAITGPASDPDGTFSVSWTPASGTASRYELEERVSGVSFAQIQSSLALEKDFVAKINNAYEYRARACNALSCGSYTAIKSVHVTDNPGDPNLPNAPPAPQVLPTPPPNASSDAVGVVPGAFRVDEAGAAAYSIPIATLPGSGGVAPVISLDYSSQAGNGIAGVGFRLNGTSVISRCRQSRETDNAAMGAVQFTSADRFCLDGQRLVRVAGTYGASGAEYRTEIDSFVKVISYGSQGGGPGYFKVWRKDGSIAEYGNTPDSKIEAFGAGSVVFAWAQNKFTDSTTNYLDFSYVEDSANGVEFVLERVRYTGNTSAGTNPYAELRFLYDTDRADKTRGYFAGMPLKQTRRLTDIESWAGATFVRRYTFDYEAAPTGSSSRLTSVTLCGPTACLEPTTFTWQDAGGGFETTASSEYYTRYFKGGKPADVDGDGDADLVWLRTNNNGEPKIEIMRSEDGRLISQGQVIGANSSEAASWQILDYNNDGKHDLLLAEGNYWRVRLGGTDAYGDPTFGAPINTGLAPDGYNRAAVADFDGNGLADFLYAQGGILYLRALSKSGSTYAFGAAQAMTLQCAPTDGCDTYLPSSVIPDNIRPVVADFNGDGLVDLLLRVTVMPWCEPELGSCTSSSAAWRVYVRDPANAAFRYYDTINTATAAADPKVTLGDINGDGLTDLAFADGTSNTWKSRVSTGSALGAATTIVTLASTHERTAMADYDGDGRQDFLYTAGGTWYVRLATQSGLSSAATDTGLAAKVGSFAQSGWVGHFHDINGDGRSDYARYFLGDSTSLTQAHVRLGKDPFVPANVVTAVSNGFGASIEIEYQALTDPARSSNYYTKSIDGRLASWGNGTPIVDLLGPIYTVKRVESSAPAAGASPLQVDPHAMRATAYAYAGGKLQGGGRGFLGFASRTTIDEQTGIETTANYLQKFPFIGHPAITTVKTAIGQALSSTSYTWTDKTNGSGTFRQPYLSQTIEHRCDLATAQSTCTSGVGSLLSKVTTATTVDAYGNALTVKVSTVSDGATFAKHTTNTYTDDVGNWKLGRLTEAVVVHSRTGQPDITRTARFRYAAGSKILDQEITEPNGSNAEKLTTTYTLDAFGNRRVATVTGWDGTAIVNRVTTLTFDTLGRYADETRNAYNQLTEDVTERNALGLATRIDDSLGNETRIAYGDLGREYFRGDDTGAFSLNALTLCSQLGDCPDAAHYRSRTTIAGGGRSDVYFDVLGREVRTATVGFDGTEAYVDTEYDPLGRVARKSEPYFANDSSHWTEFDYDLLGRVTSVRHPDYPTTGHETTSDYAGFVTTLTNGKNQQKLETRNAVGELIEVEDALGNTVSYSYDATGNLKSSTQAATDTSTSAVTTLVHDKLGRKTSMVDADMGAWSYSYNAFGELIRQNTAISGKYTTVAYDLLGRMVRRIDHAGGFVEADAGWLYDACTNGLGKLCQEDTIPGGAPSPASLTRSFGYDPYGRPSTVTTTISGQVYTAATTYDQHGRVFQAFDGAETYSGLEYQYTPDGHLEAAIESRGSASVTVERYRITGQDARGQVTGMSKGGVDVSRSYASDTGRIQSLSAQTVLATPIQQFSFEFDVLGNLAARTDLRRNLAESYGYDALNRLTAVSGSSSLSVTYDGLGNLTSKSDVGSYGYLTSGTRPHALTSAGGVSYGYDANGNLTTGSDGRANGYTVFNKPYAMSASGHSVTIDYGPNRERYRRIDVNAGQTTTTNYVGSIERITRPGGAIEIKRYLDGEAIETISGGTRTTEYLFTDHLGSVDVITDANGTIVQSMAFDAFGQRRDAVDYAALTEPMLFGYDTSRTTRGFTFHEQLDPVGLIHMNGRVYDPALGRFLSADPFVEDPSNTQSLNRYSYVFNNPLSYTDPSGYESWSLDLSLSNPFVFIVHVAVDVVHHYLSRNGAPTPGSVSGSFGNGASSVLTTGACGARDGCLNATEASSTTTGDVTIDRSLGGTGSEEMADNYGNGAATETFSATIRVGNDAAAGIINVLLLYQRERVYALLHVPDSADESSLAYSLGESSILAAGAYGAAKVAVGFMARRLSAQQIERVWQSLLRDLAVDETIAAREFGRLSVIGSGQWRSSAGLIYGQGSMHGNRVRHVLAHAALDPTKPLHSVFNVARNKVLGLVDEAWSMRGSPLSTDPGAFIVPMGRVVGTQGETAVKIIVRPGTSEIITAYPVLP